MLVRRMASFELPLNSLSETESFGRRLGHVLVPNSIVSLNGPLGAGKTHLTRAIAEGLEVRNPAAVNSPTFVLIQEYPARLPIFHFDAYRLSGAGEFLSLGAHEYFSSGGVCLIEWAERVESALPDDRIDIQLAILSPTARQMTVHARGDSAQFVLNSLQKLESSDRDR